jgi:hypothetical protein
MRFTPPWAFSAAAQAWLPTLMRTPTASSTFLMKASAPFTPSKKVTADMPITRWSGLQVMTLRTASSTLRAITSVPARELSLLTALASGVKMRE